MNAHRLKADPRIMLECKSLTSQAGDAACQSLIEKMRDPKTSPPSVQLQPSLVVRGSTARLVR